MMAIFVITGLAAYESSSEGSSDDADEDDKGLTDTQLQVIYI